MIQLKRLKVLLFLNHWYWLKLNNQDTMKNNSQPNRSYFKALSIWSEIPRYARKFGNIRNM